MGSAWRRWTRARGRAPAFSLLAGRRAAHAATSVHGTRPPHPHATARPGRADPDRTLHRRADRRRHVRGQRHPDVPRCADRAVVPLRPRSPGQTRRLRARPAAGPPRPCRTSPRSGAAASGSSTRTRAWRQEAGPSGGPRPRRRCPRWCSHAGDGPGRRRRPLSWNGRIDQAGRGDLPPRRQCQDVRGTQARSVPTAWCAARRRHPGKPFRGGPVMSGTGH